MKVYLKILSLVLVSALLFSMVACSASNATADQTKNDSDSLINTENTESNTENTNTGTEESKENENNEDVTFVPVENTDSYTAVENVNMQSSTDSFNLLETTYAVEDKFVYTATVSFESGVASGLAFGAEDNSHYWVFNVDREANRVKLLYFTVEEGKTKAVELLTDYFIGNDKMTDSERRLVGSKVATVEKVQLKVVITPEDDGVYAEFYADNIRRFGIENTINLNDFEEDRKSVV